MKTRVLFTSIFFASAGLLLSQQPEARPSAQELNAEVAAARNEAGEALAGGDFQALNNEATDAVLDAQREADINIKDDPYFFAPFRKKLFYKLPLNEHFSIGLYGEDIMRLAAVYCDLHVKKLYFEALQKIYFDTFFANLEEKTKELFDAVDKLDLNNLDRDEESKTLFLETCSHIFKTECTINGNIFKPLIRHGVTDFALAWAKDKTFPSVFQKQVIRAATLALPSWRAHKRFLNAVTSDNDRHLALAQNDIAAAQQDQQNFLEQEGFNRREPELIIPFSALLCPIFFYRYNTNLMFNTIPDSLFSGVINSSIESFLATAHDSFPHLPKIIELIGSSWFRSIVQAYGLWSFPKASFAYNQTRLMKEIEENFDEFVMDLDIIRNIKNATEGSRQEALKTLLIKQHGMSFESWVCHMNNHLLAKRRNINLCVGLPACVIAFYIEYKFFKNALC